jgi:hypothetical protein
MEMAEVMVQDAMVAGVAGSIGLSSSTLLAL